MQRHIIISLKTANSFGKTQQLIPLPETLITEQLEQFSKNSHLTEKSQENHDEPASNVGTPLQTDRWIYRIVVGALALTLVSSIGGAVWLQSNDKDIPEILIGLGTGALGGLAGLLAPTPSKE
jgi:hypothetical protein